MGIESSSQPRFPRAAKVAARLSPSSGENRSAVVGRGDGAREVGLPPVGPANVVVADVSGCGLQDRTGSSDHHGVADLRVARRRHIAERDHYDRPGLRVGDLLADHLGRRVGDAPHRSDLLLRQFQADRKGLGAVPEADSPVRVVDNTLSLLGADAFRPTALDQDKLDALHRRAASPRGGGADCDGRHDCGGGNDVLVHSALLLELRACN